MDRFRAAPPSLNLAKDLYDRGETEQFRNVLRLFFTRLTAIVNQNIDDIDILDDSKADHQNGFVDATGSAITFVDGTRTFTINPIGASYTYYVNSTPYIKTAAESIVIDDTEGFHYIYWDGATLTKTTTFSDSIITDYAFISAVYWDATNNTAVLVADERHGLMDSINHLYNHQTFGARYGNGLNIGNMSVDGSGNVAVDAQFSVSNGTIWDEDIEHVITDGSPQELSTIAEIPVYYRSGANGDWRKVAATVYPITTTGTGRAAWNEDTGATWQLTEVTNNSFVLMHYYATNDVNNPVIGIMGQADYGTLAQAREGAYTEISNLQVGQLATLTPEYVAIATVIWQTSNSYSNAVKSRVRSTDTGDDYIDWRSSSIGTGGTSAGEQPYSPPTVRNETSTSYTMVAGDENDIVRFTGASPAVTIPQESSVNYATGTELNIRQAGTGTLTLTTTGLTINGTVPSWAQHVEVKFRKVGSDTWDVV